MANQAGRAADPVGQRDHILVAMEAGQDRELLASWLGGLSQYDVTTITAGDAIPETYDLCLLDPPSLETYRTVLNERVEHASPMYLPHVLLQSNKHDRVTDSSHEQLIATEPAIEEVLTLPMEKARLRQRIENLLKARRSSVELSSREKQYRTLLELLPEMVLLVEDGSIVYANETATRELADDVSHSEGDTEEPAGKTPGAGGRTADEPGRTESSTLEGRSLDSFVTGDDRSVLREMLDSATDRDGNAPSPFVNFTMESLAGTELYVGATSLTVTFEGRTVTQLIVRNLTSRRQREKRLTLFGRAIDASAQGVTIADAQQDDEPLVYANEAFERITGYPIDETLGRNCRFLQGANTDEETVSRLRAAIDTGEPVSVDILNYRKDGTAFWNRVDIVPIEDEQGTVTHFLGLQRDITDRKRSRQRLSVLNRILRHNLRNKVNVIQAYTEQIETGETPSEEALAIIREAADDLLEVSEHAREFDSVIAASHDEMQTVDLVDIVDTNVQSLRSASQDAELTVTTPDSALIAVHPGLRAALGDLFVQLGSAESPRASIEIAREDGLVVLGLTDRASALSEHDLEIIGYDVETPTEHLQGIELWLLRWAVERSRGEMTVSTDADHPTIELRFPAMNGGN